jgi:predicted N-acyltransferase
MSAAPRATVETAQALPAMSWAQEETDLTYAWPYLCPTFLAGNEAVLPELRPWHTIALRSRGELALLPGYVLEAPPAVDHDPRTYLGWQAATGDEVCCGVDLPCGLSAEVDALGLDAFFPCLLLGSPLGYRSEVAYNFWTPRLFDEMVAALTKRAFDEGIRSVLAPWIPDREGNAALVAALVRSGGHDAFWGYEDYVPLSGKDWKAHLASLPIKMRQRIVADERKAAASGVAIDRVEGDAIRVHVQRIAELTCLNRAKNGAGEEVEHIAGVLGALLDAGADVRAYLARLDDRVVGSCVVLRKERRLFAKWVGFDYEAVGDRSGIYFELVIDRSVRDACGEGLASVEFGAGAHQAKRLRGSSSRAVTTVLAVADPALRPDVARFMDLFGRARRVAFGDAVPALDVAPATEERLVAPR